MPVLLQPQQRLQIKIAAAQDVTLYKWRTYAVKFIQSYGIFIEQGEGERALSRAKRVHLPCRNANFSFSNAVVALL
jgi:hypothetical protein